MADPKRRFEIAENTPDLEPHPLQAPVDALGTSTLILGLKTLSQRAISAVKDIFTLLSVASAWWLWMSIADPKPTQLGALALYAAFVLAANWIVRRK